MRYALLGRGPSDYSKASLAGGAKRVQASPSGRNRCTPATQITSPEISANSHVAESRCSRPTVTGHVRTVDVLPKSSILSPMPSTEPRRSKEEEAVSTEEVSYCRCQRLKIQDEIHQVQHLIMMKIRKRRPGAPPRYGTHTRE